MCPAAALWAGLASVVHGADSQAAARAGFPDRAIHGLFDRPRDTWPMSVRRRAHDLSEIPLRAWTDTQRAE